MPEPRPVVAAIVTSHAGVLIARRNDGKPPWTFIAGEGPPGGVVELDKDPRDTVRREVLEKPASRSNRAS